ncbi:peroxidase [Reticulomyxa filosa]|uniref:Peroxidase n=1 Tax=Reticulomyxa filosa TaxID=46433 RepID=X6P8D1_RETFI|nr:peroxidase [Reticulomyxa filosa]|eukprot:ETO34441.1 peroxidase [Reticulomyxa filosa]
MLPLIYGSVDKVDLYIGGLLERPEAETDDRTASAILGALFAAIVRDQFSRLFAGDRLLYIWNSTLLAFVQGTTLGEVIERNSEIVNISSVSMFNNLQSVASTSNSNTYIDSAGNSWAQVALLDSRLRMRWRIDSKHSELHMNFGLQVGDSSEGFIGFGIGKGSTMQGKDIVKMMWYGNAQTLEIQDCYSPNWMPVADTSKGYSNDVTPTLMKLQDGYIEFEFHRPLAATDKWDHPILTGDQNFIVSINTKSYVNKHATNDRSPGRINWYTGDAVQTPVSFTRVLLGHGLTMIALFLICYPISAVIARYFRHTKNWREVHKMIGSLGTMTCVTAVGHVSNFWLNNFSRGESYFPVKFAHLIISLTINVLAPYTAHLGWARLRPIDNEFLLSPYPWYIFPFLCLLIGELYRRYGTRLYNNWDQPFTHTYHVFSLSEIGEKVSAGAAWVMLTLRFLVFSYMFSSLFWNREIVLCVCLCLCL